MEPYTCVPLLDYSSLSGMRGITKMVVHGHQVFFGMKNGYLILVEFPVSLEATQLIHAAKIKNMCSIFDLSTGQLILNNCFRTSTDFTMFYPQVFDFEGSTNGSIINILLGPSTALFSNEILCLSKAGCLTLVNKSFQYSPEYCLNDVIDVNQRTHLDESNHVQLSFPDTTGNNSQPVLCVLKSTSLLLLCRTENTKAFPFVALHKLNLQALPLHVHWIEDMIVVIYEASYQFFATQPDFIGLETPVLGDQIKGSIGKLHLVHTNLNEILISASNYVTFFFDVSNRSLVNKSNIAWKAVATFVGKLVDFSGNLFDGFLDAYKVSAGPFIIGSTTDNELLVFTSKNPIVQCQTLPTQGHVLDIAVCHQLDGLETLPMAGVSFNETKPVLVTTSDGLWMLLPVPFLAQLRKSVVEFNISKVFSALDVYVPSHCFSRHETLCYLNEIFGWRYLEEEMFTNAFVHFQYTAQTVNIVARLILLWNTFIGIPLHSTETLTEENFGTPYIWRKLLYQWLEHQYDNISDNIYDDLDNDVSSSIVSFALRDSFHNIREKMSDFYLSTSCSMKDSEPIPLPLVDGSNAFLQFLYDTRLSIANAIAQNTPENLFKTPDIVRKDNLSTHLHKMMTLWNQQECVTKTDSISKKITSLLTSESEEKELLFFEARFFLRLVDVFLISLTILLDSQSQLKNKQLSQNIQNLLTPSSSYVTGDFPIEITFDTTFFTQRCQNILNLIRKYHQSLFCLHSWFSHTTCSNATPISPSFCSVKDFSHLSMTKISDFWSLQLFLHELDFEKLLHLCFFSNKSLHKRCVPLALLALFNLMCQCHTCHSSCNSRTEFPTLLTRTIPLFLTHLPSEDDQVAFLLLITVGCHSTNHPRLHDDQKQEGQPKDTEPLLLHKGCTCTDSTDWSTQKKYLNKVYIVSNSFESISFLLSLPEFVNQTFEKKALILYLLWSSRCYFSLPINLADLVTQTLHNCLNYLIGCDNILSNDLSVSFYNILYLLEVETYYDPHEILTFINSNSKQEPCRFAAAKSLCFFRVNQLQNVLRMILNPGDLNSFALCEKLCQVITGMIDTHDRKTAYQKELTDLSYSHKCPLTFFFYNELTTNMPHILPLYSMGVYTQEEPNKDQLTHFSNHDFLLDESQESFEESLSCESPKQENQMLFHLFELLVEKWHEFDQAVNDSMKDYYKDFFKYCILTLLHKYVGHPELDFVNLLELIPDSCCMASYITHSFRDIARRESLELLRESLICSCSSRTSAELAIAASKHVTISRESTCPICSKRLALPNTQLFGNSGSACKSRQHLAPLLALDTRTNECGHMECLQKISQKTLNEE